MRIQIHFLSHGNTVEAAVEIDIVSKLANNIKFS